jgi:hypothetical protein
MPRKKLTAAEYLDSQDEVMRLILGEMVQHTANANVYWDAAQRLIAKNPEAALTHLVDAWIALNTFIPIERSDALRVVNRTMALLDRELPDDEEPGTDAT